MDIESDHLGIPDMEYKTTIRMPSSEFQRIIRDLGVLGETCQISVTKEGIRFTVEGDLGSGNILIRSTAGVVDVKEEDEVVIEMEEPVELTFALRYGRENENEERSEAAIIIARSFAPLWLCFAPR